MEGRRRKKKKKKWLLSLSFLVVLFLNTILKHELVAWQIQMRESGERVADQK